MKRLEAVHVLTDRFLFPLSLKKKMEKNSIYFTSCCENLISSYMDLIAREG